MKQLMRAFAVVGAAAALGLMIPSTSAAAERCSDVLTQDGVMQRLAVSQNSFLKQLVYKRFLENNQDDRNQKTGFDGSYGLWSFGGDHASEELRRSQVERTFINDLTSQQDLQIALTSGDPEILKAWSACMAERGGLSAHFETYEGRKATLALRWHSAFGVQSVTIGEDVRLPDGVVVVSGADCLAKGAVLTSSICTSNLELPSAETSALVVVNTTQAGSASAYLPPRMQYSVQRRPHKFSAEETLTFTRRGDHRENLQATARPDIENGWRFDKATARFTVKPKQPDDEMHCGKAHSQAGLFEFAYGYEFFNDDNAFTNTCLGSPSIEEVRDVWVPMP